MSFEQYPHLPRKIIIGTGYEKCGTTTAHDVLSKSSIVAAPSKKETVFFNRDFDRGLDYYLSLYEIREQTKVMIDITPSYHLTQIAYDRIKKLAADHLIVLFVRDPIRRAFSLYWHNIVNHFSIGETAQVSNPTLFSTPFKKSFSEVASTYNNYCIDLNRSIRRATESFGLEKTILIYFDEVMDGSFLHKIESSLGYKLGITNTAGWSNKRSPIKYDLVSNDGQDILVLKRGNTITRKWPIEQIGWSAACRVLASTQYWTQHVTRKEYEIIYNKLYKDMDLASVGLDRDRLFEFGEMTSAG